MKIRSLVKYFFACIIVLIFGITGLYPATLKNISNRIVLVRLNSGIEFQLAPKAAKNVPDKEISGNRVIEKMVNERILQVITSTPARKKKVSPSDGL